jgi:long-chain acyl-CoA synthetase
MRKDIETLGELCLAAAQRYKSRKALELCRGDRLLETLSYRTLARRSLQLAGLFRSLGLGRGVRIMILAENRPEWPLAALGAALAGLIFLPVDPRPPAGFPVEDPPAGTCFRDLGERAAVKALCITGGTGKPAAGLKAGLPRIYLDRFSGDRGGIRVSLGGIEKWLPLTESPGPEPWGFAGTGGPGPDDPVVLWPDGTENSHGELLSLAAGGISLFPRDRVLPLSSLAEKGTLVLGILAALRGGASLSFVEGGRAADTAELRRTLELLRPSVLIGEAAILEALYRDEAEDRRSGFPARNVLARALTQYRGGRALVKALGENVRFFGLAGKAEPGPELEGALSRVYLPRAMLESPGNSGKTGRVSACK